MRFRYVILLVSLICIASAIPAASQSSLDQFRYAPVSFFAGRTWVGTARLFMTNYSDTVHVAPDSAGTGLVIRRTLVDEDDSVVVSRAHGSLTPVPGEAAYQIRWTENRYPEATGRMQWEEDRWAVTFDGQWQNWFIYLQKVNDTAFLAKLARALGDFSPVEIAGVQYQVVTSAGSSGSSR